MYITRNSNLFYELQVIAKVANVALNFLMCIQFFEMTRSDHEYNNFTEILHLFRGLDSLGSQNRASSLL